MKLISTLIATLVAMFGLVPVAAAQGGERIHRPVIVTAGDSITYGAGAVKEMSYPAQLQRMNPNLKVINAGHSASCLVYRHCGHPDSLVRTFDNEVLGQNPDIIVISIGRNDLCHIPTTRYKRALQGLRKAGEAAGAEVIFGTITPPNERWQFPCEEQAVEINEWLEKRSTTIDFARALSDHHGSLRKVYDHGDGLHPNDVGYRAMAKAASDRIRGLL